MRYQEPIYIQNENSAVRNKRIFNVNMSSDLCIFESPLFSMSGASKIDCSGSTGTTYIISTATTIPLIFDFTANTESFITNDATFKYEIYKYNSVAEIFTQPPIYQSETFNYSGFSGTSAITENVPVSNLNLDGEYLVKGFYQFSACTTFLSKLGKTIDTLTYIDGSQYGLYDNNLDYYFIAFKAADTPLFSLNGNNTPPANQLFQQVIIPTDGQETFVISYNYAGYFILTLNGLVLAPEYDYTYSGNVVTFNAPCVLGDIITVNYTTTGGNNLVGDNISIDIPIVSGITDGQGINNPYYNITTDKYEVYTSVTPALNGDVLVMINGVTLASGLDYYQSTSNTKRIILEGDLIVGDLITLVYFPSTSTINGLSTSLANITWSIANPPQTVNGEFTVEISTGSSFTTLYSSSTQPYIIGVTLYNDSFTVSGTVGTTLYYRIKNEKSYITLCDDTITSIAYSDTIPIIIQTNAINSY